jgi:acyl-CoA reductase-like NAD-dependent aldehyde dehydrogenase
MSEIAKHWIDGEWTGSGAVSQSVNPATGGVLQSGIGRLRGSLAITEFQEAKTVVHAIPPFQV